MRLDLAALLESEGSSGKVDPPSRRSSLRLIAITIGRRRDVDRTRRRSRASPPGLRRHRSPRDGGIGPYLDMLAPRLDALVRRLGPRGRGSGLTSTGVRPTCVRAILDEIMGRDAFPERDRLGDARRTSVVKPRAGSSAERSTPSSSTGRRTRRFAPPDAPRADRRRTIPLGRPRAPLHERAARRLYRRVDREARRPKVASHRTPSGRVYIKYFLVKNPDGVLCRERRVDALWTDVAPLRHAIASERPGYPTQKPRALPERIVACATPPGGLVVDAFVVGVAPSRRLAANARASCGAPPTGARSPSPRSASRLMREGAGVRIERVLTTTPPARPSTFG